MNAQLTWTGLALLAVWAALLWWTLRMETSTTWDGAIKFGIVLVLMCIGAAMVWNMFQLGRRN